MPAWATVVLTLGVGVIGGLIALAATSLQGRQARERAEAEASAARRARAAEVLGRIRTLIADLTPDRWSINLDREKTPGEFVALEERWEPLREQLSIFAAADEDPAVTDAASRLEVAIANTIHDVGWDIGDRIRYEPDPVWRMHTNIAHRRALVRYRILSDLIRGLDTSQIEQRLSEIDGLEQGLEPEQLDELEELITSLAPKRPQPQQAGSEGKP